MKTWRSRFSTNGVFFYFRLSQIEADEHHWGKCSNPKTDHSIPSVVQCISQKVIPPEQPDRDLIAEIEKLDRYIQKGSDYGVYEDLFHSLKDKCQNRFEKWLVAKGLQEGVQDLSFCLDTYLDFIYAYIHDDMVILKSVPDIYFMEFFEDFLLRKMLVEPNEYVHWPPALKLFYQFLHEKSYLNNHGEIIEKIDRVEPYFIEVLRKQFS